MKTKDIHVLNWKKISQHAESSDSTRKANKGILFEDLIESLLTAMFHGKMWRRTGESHDGKRDFVYPYNDYYPDQKWAECKNYNSNLSLNVIAPTLIMGTIENIESIFFFSYSPLNDNAIEGLLRYSESTKRDIKVYDGNVLESLICKYHNVDNVADFFPCTDFEKAYDILKDRKYRIIKIIKDVNGNKLSPFHLFELGEVFYIDVIIQNFTHEETNYKILMKGNRKQLLKYDMPVCHYSLPFAHIGEYSILCEALKPGNTECCLEITSHNTTTLVKKKIKIIDESYAFWTGTNALAALDQCMQHLKDRKNLPLLIAAGSGMGKSTLINILLQNGDIQSKYTILKVNLNLTRNCCMRNLLSALIGLHEGQDLPKEQFEDDNKAFAYLIGNYAESADMISSIIMHLYNCTRPYLFVIDNIQEIDRAYISLLEELNYKAKKENKSLYFIFALDENKCSIDKLSFRLNWDWCEQEQNFNIVRLTEFEKDDILAFLKHKFGLVEIERYFANFDRKIRPLEMHNFCTNVKRQRIIAPAPDSRVYQIIDPFKFEDSIRQIQGIDVPLKDICESMGQSDVPEHILKYLYITDKISPRIKKAYSKIISNFFSLRILKEKDGLIEFYHDEIRNYVRNKFIFTEEDYADIYFDKETDAVSKALCALNQLGILRGSASFLQDFFHSNYIIQRKAQRLEICRLIFENLNLLTQYSLTADALFFVKSNYTLLNAEQGHSTFFQFLKQIADAALINEWDTDEESVENMAYFIKKFFDRSLSTYNYQHCLCYFEKYEKKFFDMKHITDSRRYFWLSHYANRVAIALDRNTVPLSEEPQKVSNMYEQSEKYYRCANYNSELLLQISVDDFNRHYTYRHDLTINIVLNTYDKLLKIKENNLENDIILDYHLLLLQYLKFKLEETNIVKKNFTELSGKVVFTRKNCTSAFYMLKLYMLEIYIFMDFEDYSRASSLLSEAFEFAYKKEMRSYIYKLTYIKAHIQIFQENLEKSSESYCLIELAFEQLMNQRKNSINDLKREIFLLVRLVQLIKAYDSKRIPALIQSLSAEIQTLVKKICNAMGDMEDLFNMKSYFTFKNISFPNI